MQNIQDLFKKHQKDNLKLHEFINPQFAKVLKTIGFDKSFVKAKGLSLWDTDGNEYTDFLSGYGVFALGRNHPKIKKGIGEFLELDTASLIQMEAPILSGVLAEKLIKLFGHGKRDKVFFTNSGTEAVEAALKFTRAATKRDKILYLDHAFHGLTTGSLAANGNKEFRDSFGNLLPGHKVAMGDLDSLELALKTKEYAAFIFEPIQGKGVYYPKDDYFTKALELCRKYGTLTIADEIQSGLGRTGKWLAIDHDGLEPDVITISKALSGGMVPVGAVIYTSSIYNQVFSRMDRCVVHSNTFGQNNLAMVCALVTLQIIEDESLIENAAKMGEMLLTELQKLKEKHSWIKDIRGKGLMIGIEFGKPQGLKKKIAWEAVHKIDKGLFGELVVIPLFSDHRIVTQVSGHHQDIIKLLPSLTIEKHHIKSFINALDDVLSKCDKITGPILKMGKNLAKHIVKKSA
jgi:ornithine--oxo-acid transaminase